MASERKLGRGLDFLIKKDPTLIKAEARAAASTARDGFEEVAMDKITPNPHQPRKNFGADAIAELSTSIAQSGLMQPLVVRPVGDRFELIAGERRFRACRSLAWKTVPVIIRDVDSRRSLELALVENVQRQDLNPIETAEALRDMMSTLELTQEDVAKKIGKQRSTVANLLRLLELPADIQAKVSSGTLTMGHARALASLPGDNAKRALVKEILDGGLSVRAVEQKTAFEKLRAKPPAEKPPYVIDLQQKLSEALGLKVEIKDNAGRGHLTVRFRDHKEFDRVFARLMRGPE